MNQLIPISGYANSYKELCTKVAGEGEFYNVLEEYPFLTYIKTDETQIGDTLETTDVIGWYENKAELESNVTKPANGDVYITGSMSPYTRWKAVYDSGKLDRWEDDGTEEKKIVKKFANTVYLGKAHLQPEEGIYYSVGKTAPYKVYGVVSEWEPVGTFISYLREDIDKLKFKPEKSNVGEIANVKGIFYLYDGNDWVELILPEPMKNVNKHTYTDGEHNYRLREGSAAGTLEFYEPRG